LSEEKSNKKKIEKAVNFSKKKEKTFPILFLHLPLSRGSSTAIYGNRSRRVASGKNIFYSGVRGLFLHFRRAADKFSELQFICPFSA